MNVGLMQSITMASGPVPRGVRDSGSVHGTAKPTNPAQSNPAQPNPARQNDPIALAEKAINHALQTLDTHVSIAHDKAADRYVFLQVDETTGEVVKQYPTKEMLGQIARVRQIIGLAVDTGS